MTLRRGRYQKKYRLTKQQLEFVSHYLRKGETYLDAQASLIAMGKDPKWASRYGYRYLRRPAVKNFIAQALEKIKVDIGDTYKENILRAKQLRDACAPEGELNRGNLDVDGCLKSMDMINKMEGHYAPEKRAEMNVIVDSDIEHVKETFKKFEKDH